MVVKRLLFGGHLLLCAVVLVSAMPETADPRGARFALVVENGTADPAVDLLLDAARAAIVDREDAFWFLLSERDTESARGVQAEMLAVLRADADVDTDDASPDGGDRQYRVSLRFYRISRDGVTPVGEPEAEAAVTVRLDRAGRYQRPATWETLVTAVGRVVDSARPIAEVTVSSPIPFTLTGVPGWIQEDLAGDAVRSVTLALRTLRTYRFTMDAPGHRSEEILFYLDQEPISISVRPRKYPRHTVAFMARGVSWPGLEYQWYDSRTRWTVHGGVTSFALGVTPLRQMAELFEDGNRTDRQPQVFTSLPLTEFEVGGGRLLGHRDLIGRWHLSGSAVVRLFHGDPAVALEPVMPLALRIGLGRERELWGRFFLSQRVATEWYWPVQQEFLRPLPWAYQLGPAVWQLPVYRIGLRVVL